MKRIYLIIAVALALALVVTLAQTQAVAADDGLIRVTDPHPRTPGRDELQKQLSKVVLPR
jgi:hypothetical protein